MLAITGATGQLGHLVIDALLEETSPGNVIAIGRNAEKAADLIARGVTFRPANYDEPSTLGPALAGATRLLLISGSEVGKREAQHKAVIDAARDAGVELIAYTSILHADTSPIGLAVEHRATEALLAKSAVPFTLLRNGWYAENYGGQVAPGLQFGLSGCAGNGRICPATRADFAAACARVLLDDGHAGKTYELAGDDCFTMTGLAAEISKQSGKNVTYTDMSEAEYTKVLINAGLPAPIAAMVADSNTGASKDALFDDSHDLSRLIGRPTKAISEVVREALAAL